MSDNSFGGFPQAGLDFLSELGTEDKEWFTANRKDYDAHVVAPAKAFVSAMGEALADAVSPSIEAQPKTNGSIAPINNDLRFSPDASPYKDHLMFRFWDGPTKKTAPTLMVRMHPTEGIGFATGIALADIDRWRTLIADDATGAPFATALDKLVKGTKADVVGQELKKVPAGFDPDHPRADLLRHKGFQTRWIKPSTAALTKPTFISWCTKELARTADVHRWLVEHLN